MADLLALTLWPEWAAMVAWLDKPTENRGPESPRWLCRALNTRIAIHAGAHIGGRPGGPARDEGIDAVSGMAALAGWDLCGWNGFRDRAAVPELYFYRRDPDTQRVRAAIERGDLEDAQALLDELLGPPDRVVPIVRSAIVATAVVVGFDTQQRTPWDVRGASHWRLGDVRRLAEPVPCKGAQGLWTVPEDVVERVRAQGGCP